MTILHMLSNRQENCDFFLLLLDQLPEPQPSSGAGGISLRVAVLLGCSSAVQMSLPAE